MQVRILGELFDLLDSRGIDPEFLRRSFSDFKSGDEFEHRLFCHDVGSDPGNYLRHVHFFPTVQADQNLWKNFTTLSTTENGAEVTGMCFTRSIHPTAIS